ncbi:glycoside hydrolase family 72 [Grosmannia clavigera kw1407]|uniref:1,3-beta-glucanosyltransferase n=1 Tax=Grosmannia clavigera (strain kw1407 / UAMH 11150) TaxID=655863 RepID=F0XP11_GROCL|nr:glycoside hydrolase family 72 [Grosmannia clavigera kw1407]EFX00365.1 glycoside hydrolase family 72 [Grosmannia clavigera kw1407]
MGFKSVALSTLLLLGQAAAASTTASASTASTSVEPIIMKGTKFFFKNGTQFFLKGVAYQQDTGAAGTTTSTTFIDPLSDESNCERDVPLLKALHTNVIRTYAIDPTADHSACMKLLAAAGIYVVSDLSEPSNSINRDSPAWNTALFSRYKAVVDEMSQYDNVIGFFAGNEVTNNATNTDASAYVKAAVRDTKAYINSTVSRWMGVGYAANDDATIRDKMAYYFNCGDQESAIDFWGYNIYEWCGQSTFVKSGYQTQVEFFSNYSVPVFFAEYGCNTPSGAAGRIWEETTALYSSEMTDVISGGIVYMYFEETNDYGLVTVDGTSASTLAGYSRLKSVIATVSPSSTAMSAYTATNSPASCPTIDASWKASDTLPPTPDNTTCDCMYSSLSCIPATGLNSSAYAGLFGQVCGLSSSACAGINGNTSTGVYGAYIMCSAEQKVAYVLNEYYKEQSSASTACDWDSQAQVVKAASVAASCSTRLAAASSSNSYAATATAKGTSTSKTTSTSKSSSSSKSAAAGNPMRSLGDLTVGLYVVVAMLAGASMVLL